MTHTIKNRIRLFIVAFSLLSVLAMPTASALALTKSQLQAQQQAAQAAAAAAKAAAAEKAKQALEIQTQMTALDSSISTVQNSIAKTSSQITETQASIKELEKQITDTVTKMDQEKQKMNQLLSSWYMEGSSGFLEAVLSSSNISDVVDTEQQYDSVKQQINTSIDKITAINKDLVGQKDKQNVALTQLNDLKKSQIDQTNYLSGRKTMKTRLLTDTNNAITDLKSEQKAAEQKAAELQAKINQINSASVGTGGDLISGSASWYYSQVDPSWSNEQIGSYSYITIGRYGCLLTSLTMISKYYGRNYNPSTAADASNFGSSGALISTPIVHDGGSQGINWNIVDDELASGHPVIVGIALGIDMGNSYGVSHFVVLKSKYSNGKYEMLDPLGPSRGYTKDKVKAMRIIRP